MAVIKTNWINFLGVFLAVFLYDVIVTLCDTHLSYNIFQSALAALISVCGYGMMFWALFAVSLVILDMLVVMRNKNHLKEKLLLEWLVISSPFLYWTVKYKEWIFLIAIVAFFIAQLSRERLIKQARRLN